MPENPPPFIIHAPAGVPCLPVVFDNPHSGVHLPAGFTFGGSDRGRDLLRDSHINLLLSGAPGQGITVLENPIDRVFIDPNRDEDEIDPQILKDSWPHPLRLTANVVERGLGLIVTSLRDDDGQLVSIFNDRTRPDAADILSRIEGYYRPYNRALRDLIDSAYQEHGISLHFNFHSTPRQPRTKDVVADITLGNLYGKSCHPDLVHFVSAFFLNEGLTIGLNAPFPGGALIRKTNDPANHRHSLQIEIVRQLYMNTDTFEFDPAGGGAMRDVLTKFGNALHDFTRSYADKIKPRMK